MKFYINRSGTQYYVTFVASNGATIAHTERYTTKANAKNAAELIKSQGGSASIIDNT